MIDLHMHTTYSDGTESCTTVLKKCQEKNLNYISITDHNTALVYEELEDCIPTYSMEREIEHNELVKELNMFLENLSKEKRVIFLERYWYMSSIKDIATKHSQKESKTKMELLRMRNALRKYLEERGKMV